MPERPSPARAQTIKQAKAAYKSRGAPALSEREKKQLDRSIELERRAWRVRETEKRRGDAAKKKLEREKREREVQARLQMTSQRRCDKFGHERSQMHLGAFLNKKPTEVIVKPNILLNATENGDDSFGDNGLDDSFGDSGLDDDTLLEAAERLQNPRSAQRRKHDSESCTPSAGAVAVKPVPTSDSRSLVDSTVEDPSFLLDDLASSTQIARELSADEPLAPHKDIPSHHSSFGDDEFDFTIDEIEELEKLRPIATTGHIDRTPMPPPALPLKTCELASPILMFHSFTRDELENLMADEIQLTQAG